MRDPEQDAQFLAIFKTTRLGVGALIDSKEYDFAEKELYVVYGIISELVKKGEETAAEARELKP